jgi:hypothetical protein
MTARSIIPAIGIAALFAAGIPVPSSAQSCAASNVKLFTPTLFVTDKKYAGQIAYRPSGESSAYIEIVDTCTVINVARAQELEFLVGNAIEPHSESETHIGLLVQVIRFQMQEQANQIALFRMQDWARDGKNLGVIDDQPLRGVTPAEFFEIHEAMKPEEPGDDKIKINGVPWHGQPAGGIYSSLAAGTALASPEARQQMDDTSAILSNRLYRFRPNKGGQRGIPFSIRTEETKRIVIRTHSPNRSTFNRTITIDLVR